MSIILNKLELLEANSKLRGDALEILEAGYLAIDTGKVLREKMFIKDRVLFIDGNNFELDSFENIFFIGIGKCAFDGAKVIEDVLDGYLINGIALDVNVVSAETTANQNKIKYYTGTHPYPSEANVLVAKEILEMIKNATEKDLIITLISGGGSSLFCLPHVIDSKTLVEITKALTAKGADIFELNTVRKHLSEVQGGRLAELCYPAQVISLIFSDVLGNDISMVASGPTVLDTTVANDAKEILAKYEIGENQGIISPLELVETPKNQRFFDRVKNILIISNRNALEAMKIKAEEFGYNTIIETEKLSGDASEIGKELALRKPESNTCFLFGGETTVKIKTKPTSAKATAGEGGRNQEMALSALSQIQPGSILICAASDGWDNTDHAGAMADIELFEKAKNMNLIPAEYLEKSDSYNFFKKINGAICTGKLGSNVSDLCIMLYK